MSKNCLWEQFYFSLKGNFKNAKRRQTSDCVIANVDGVNVKTWYYNPEEIINMTQELYTIKKIKPIGLSIPPSYLENSFIANQPFISFFKVIDHSVNSSFWAKYADHFLIELIKK